MSKQEFLNFAEISKAIQFSDVLDWLNIPYQKKNKELKGEGFIISLEKNLFFTPNNDSLFPAVVGVPKSLHRAMYKLSIILSANFLVNNDRRSAYDDVLIFFIIKTFV